MEMLKLFSTITQVIRRVDYRAWVFESKTSRAEVSRGWTYIPRTESSAAPDSSAPMLGNVQMLARTFSGRVRLSEVQNPKPVTQMGTYGMYELLHNPKRPSHRHCPVSG